MSVNPFAVAGRVAVVTGGYGVLGGALSAGFAAVGARVAVLGRRRDAAEEKAAEIRKAGGEAIALAADVQDERQVRAARDELLGTWDRVDILINAAGGNVQRARSDDRPVFEVPGDAFDDVVRLNLQGTVIPSLAFRALGLYRQLPLEGGGSRAEGRARLLGGQGRRGRVPPLARGRSRPPLRRRDPGQRHRARGLRRHPT